jgi:hypothetical protein
VTQSEAKDSAEPLLPVQFGANIMYRPFIERLSVPGNTCYQYLSNYAWQVQQECASGCSGQAFLNLVWWYRIRAGCSSKREPPFVLKRSAAEPLALGKRSRTRLSPSFRERTGTGDTSGSPVIIDWDIDDAADTHENVDGACGVEDGIREPRD